MTKKQVILAVSGMLLALPMMAIPLAAQAPTRLRKGDRPVFYSAGTLAKDCRVGVVMSGGQPLDPDKTYSVTTDQMASMARCEGYIDGAFDATLDSYMHMWPDSHYNPVRSYLDWGPKLIDTFIKYVADHPEEEDFAASTVLAKAQKIISKAQGIQATPTN